MTGKTFCADREKLLGLSKKYLALNFCGHVWESLLQGRKINGCSLFLRTSKEIVNFAQQSRLYGNNFQ